MAPLTSFLLAVGLLTRVPVPTPGEVPVGAGAWAAPWYPVVGVAVGAAVGGVFALGAWLGLPPFMAATVAVAASLALTGALHEDGLADMADAVGGGGTRERALEILRDPRLGTFGVASLVLSLLLRIAALAFFHDATVPGSPSWPLVLAAAAVGATSRAAMVLPLAGLPPARPDGLGRHVGAGVDLRHAAAALAVAAVVAWLTGGRALVHLAVALLGAALVGRLARRRLGGVTGDVCGATQQVVEFTLWCVLVASG